jgi:hypothetical protein
MQTPLAVRGECSNDWLDCTLAAFAASREQDLVREVRLWRQAGELALSFAGDDPRRAAAYNNAGYGCLIAGERDEAASLLHKAKTHWHLAERWIEATEIPLVGHGTASHLTLASRHTDALVRIGRDKYLAIVRGGAAVTSALTRRLIGDAGRADVTEAIRHDISALKAAFGIDCAEAMRLKTAASECAPPSARKRRILFDRWPAMARRTRPEMRPLIDAVYLTAGLHQLE